MFVSSADFTEQYGANANMAMTFYGQEKVEYNSKLCLMNMAVHGLNAQIVSGDDANSFYHDHFGLEGKCDFVMANPPFNVDKVKDTPHNCAKTSRVIFGDPKFREKAQFKRTVCTRNKPRYATFIRLRARYKFASANSVQQC